MQDQVKKKRNPVKAQIRLMMEQGMTKEMAVSSMVAQLQTEEEVAWVINQAMATWANGL